MAASACIIIDKMEYAIIYDYLASYTFWCIARVDGVSTGVLKWAFGAF